MIAAAVVVALVRGKIVLAHTSDDFLYLILFGMFVFAPMRCSASA